jgi:hypothetical protein
MDSADLLQARDAPVHVREVPVERDGQWRRVARGILHQAPAHPLGRRDPGPAARYYPTVTPDAASWPGTMVRGLVPSRLARLIVLSPSAALDQ